MELKLPPIVILFAFAGGMYVLDRFLPFGDFDFFGRIYLKGFLLISAVVVSVIPLLQFFKSKTTADPTKPDKASSLVTGGIYAFTRNPMYLAMLLLLLAWGLNLGNAFNVLLAAGFVGYMNRFQIVPEEQALLQIFGKEYQQYLVKVRRWF
ncbi:methyltransferase family protein [Maribacter halichondriae]|uniref:methyltransferase family protein n=1 Tax=Maribacter halichondriae TaxID=2980554 RepID=UPI002359E6D7|nr:isoprenylcysteine carboxylmethyltransferase family protein [Maribacter sp. Hal144]